MSFWVLPPPLLPLIVGLVLALAACSESRLGPSTSPTPTTMARPEGDGLAYPFDYRFKDQSEGVVCYVHNNGSPHGGSGIFCFRDPTPTPGA